MKSFPDIDPFTYKRKDKWITNPITYYKLNKVAKQARAPYEKVKQSYLESKFNIPSDYTLENMRNYKNQFRESFVVPRLPSLNFKEFKPF